jgi:hypothetical protein
MTPYPRQLAALLSPLVLLVAACGQEADTPEASPGQVARPAPTPIPAPPVGEAPDPPAQSVVARTPSGDQRVRLTSSSAATGDKRIRIAAPGSSSGRARAPSAERSPSAARSQYQPEEPLDPQPPLDGPPPLPSSDVTSEPS